MRLHVLVVLVLLFTTADGQSLWPKMRPSDASEALESTLTMGTPDTIFYFYIYNARVDTPYHWSRGPFNVFGNKSDKQEIIFMQYWDEDGHLGHPEMDGFRLWMKLPTDSAWNALADSLGKYYGYPVVSKEWLMWIWDCGITCLLARNTVQKGYFLFEKWSALYSDVRAKQAMQRTAELEKSRWKK